MSSSQFKAHFAKAGIAMSIPVLLFAFNNCSPVGFSMDEKAAATIANGNPTDEPPTTYDGPCVRSPGETCGDPPPPPVTITNEVLTVETTKTKVDVLVVIDNSGSMETERAALGSRLKSFLDPLAGLDWRVCVTTSDVGRQNGQPIKFSNNQYALTPSTANAEQLFLDKIVGVAEGSGDEEPVRAQVKAFSNPNADCYRADAALVSVSLTDEDERSTGGYSKYRGDNQFKELTADNLSTAVVDAVKAQWGAQKVFTAHSILIKSGDSACYNEQLAQNHNVYFGTRLEQLAAMTDGKVGDICADDYSSQLTAIGNHVRTTTAALSLKCAPLSAPTVTPPAGYGGTWTTSGDKLYFNPALPAGSTVTVSYQCPGK